MVSQKKISQVDEIISAFKASNNFALIKFEKTTHQTLESLRNELRKSSSTLKVLKNTLFEKAVNKLALSNKKLLELKKQFFPLKDNSAILMLQTEWNEGLGAFYKFIQNEKTLTFKLALLDGEIYNAEQANKIAQLPSRSQLVAKIIGSVKQPSSRLVYCLKYTAQKLVFIISGKSKKTN